MKKVLNFFFNNFNQAAIVAKYKYCKKIKNLQGMFLLCVIHESVFTTYIIQTNHFNLWIPTYKAINISIY